MNGFAKPSSGKRKRLKFLCDLLGMEFPPPGHIRYQLLHRAASAVIERRRFRGQSSAMIVHSFSPENESFEDYAAFVAALGGLAELGPDDRDRRTRRVCAFSWMGPRQGTLLEHVVFLRVSRFLVGLFAQQRSEALDNSRPPCIVEIAKATKVLRQGAPICQLLLSRVAVPVSIIRECV